MEEQEQKKQDNSNSKNNQSNSQANDSTRDKEAGRALRLGARDGELLAHVAVAKYLSDAQIRKLAFQVPLRGTRRAQKGEAPLDESGVRKRLRRFAGCTPPLLRQVSYQDANGTVRSAWCVTAGGYAHARPLLRRAPATPPSEGGDQHIAHNIRLNELYVGLAASRPGLVRASLLPFNWIAESIQLPWREFNSKKGEEEERRLVPDAILEIPRDKSRVFIECEMGGHPVIRHPKSERDSVLAKLQRYGAFVFGVGQKSHYALRFVDCWKPELLVLVHSQERAESVARALEVWRADHRDHPLVVRVLDLHGALAEYAPRLGLPAPPAPTVGVAADDLRALLEALQQSVVTYKTVRHFADAHPQLRAKGLPFPEYTAEFRRANELAPELRRLVEGARK